MSKKTVLLLLLVFAAVPCIFSIPLEDLITPVQAAHLRSGGDIIMEMQLRNPSLVLMPQNNELRQHVTGIISTLNPNIMAETLCIYQKPEHSHTDSRFWDETQKTGLFNQLLALSTLAGIEYYSASRKAMRTFFDYSQVIDGPDSKNPLPDPVFSVPPAMLTLYARQKDLTFGDNIYSYNYISARDAVFFVQENLTSLSVSLVPAIGKGSLQTVLAVFDCGDILLIYAVSMARALSVPGMGERIGNSFSNRIEAIRNWFSDRAAIVFFPE